jgi:endonuclease/exonuclease/phosphatase family metal-dependent hydrolase
LKFIAVLTIPPLAGFARLSSRVQPNSTEPTPDRVVSVVSLNIAKENNAEKVVSAIRAAPRLRDADLFLFQEVAGGNANSSVAEEAARRLGYFALFEPAAPGVYDQGLALVSRYPIADVQIKRLKACDLRFRDRSRFAVAANVQTPWGGLRVWNAHLDTRINAAERLDQLQPVIEEASRHAGPRLIGGDFNTNELYWLGNVVPLPGGPSHAAAIRNAMKHHGFETLPDALNTFPSFRRHLDWIFVRDLSLLAASVEPARFSDHNAIWVQVRL